MSIVSGDILRIAVSLLFTDGNLAMNIFNAVVTGAGGPWDDADIVDDAVAWMDNIFSNMTTGTTNLLDGSHVTVYIYDAIEGDWDEVGSDPFTWNPTAATDSMPRGVAGLINAKTIDPDISGKKYLAGTVEDAADDGAWTAATLTAFASWAIDWVTAFTGGTSGADWLPGVWSPTDVKLSPLSGTFNIPTECAYQRRRKRGVGA